MIFYPLPIYHSYYLPTILRSNVPAFQRFNVQTF